MINLDYGLGWSTNISIDIKEREREREFSNWYHQEGFGLNAIEDVCS